MAYRVFTTPRRSFILADLVGWDRGVFDRRIVAGTLGVGDEVVVLPDGDTLSRGLTGVDDPYEPPRDPDVVLERTRPVTDGVAELESLLGERGLP